MGPHPDGRPAVSAGERAGLLTRVAATARSHPEPLIVGTRAGAATTARRAAWVAFVVLVVISPLRARISVVARPTVPVYGDFTDFLLFVSDVALLLTLGLWALSLALGRREVRVGPRFLAWPVAALVVVAWLSVPLAVDVPLAAYTATRLVLLVLLGLYVADEVDRLTRLVVPLALMIVGQAVVGIGQVVGQRSLGLSGLGEHVLSPILGVAVVTAHDGTRYLRAYGLTDHPNILGGLLALSLILLGGAIALDADRRQPWTVVVFALGAAALLLTFSRGAWFALVAGVVVLTGMLAAARDRGALRRLGVACAAALVVAAPFVAPYRDVIQARADSSGQTAKDLRAVSEREAVSEATTHLVVDRPILGVGIGTLPIAIEQVRPDFAYHYEPASVVLLDVTAETGLVGGGAYLVVLLAPWIALARHRRRWTGDLAVTSAALAALTVVGFFDYYTWTYSAGRIWAWVVLGLWVGAYCRATPRTLRAA
jgi:O-antigen ligase